MMKVAARIMAPALALLALAGCGSSSSSTSSSSTSATVTIPAAAVNAAIAAKVAAAVKQKGSFTVASDATYAPNEFVGSDGHTIEGMDPDLMNAIAGVLGLKANIVNATFNTIIPGLAAGKYDVGASSFTDTKERQKTVEFVDYYNAGISFYAKTGTNPGVKTVADLCGKTVSVEKGTTEEEESKAQSTKCTKAGKSAVTVLVFPNQNQANLAVSSGRAQLGMADSPVAAYQVKQSGGGFQLVGETYGVAPYGIAFPMHSPLTHPTLEALKQLIADGTYTKILEKWGLQSGAITTPVINGAKE